MSSSFVQTFIGGEQDVINLSDFLHKPASYRITLRLSPDATPNVIKPLNYYLELMDNTAQQMTAQVDSVSSKAQQAITDISQLKQDVQGRVDAIDPELRRATDILSKKMGALAINSGQIYPFTFGERDDSRNTDVSDFMLNAVLDIKVYNADVNYLYRLEYFKNGTDAIAGPDDGIAIARYPKDSYNDVTTKEVLRSYADPVPVIERNGIQSIYLPNVSGIESKEAFLITFDTDAFPEYGNYVSLSSTVRDGYNYYIHPNCYLYASKADKSIDGIIQDIATIKSYANISDAELFKQATRNNVQSPINNALSSAVVNVSIKNPVEGYYYSVNYYTNGNTALNSSGEGWQILRHAIAGFETSDTSEILINYDVTQRALVAGVNEITLQTATPIQEIVTLTVDTNKLPERGFAIKAVLEHHDGYSTIIDPSYYRKDDGADSLQNGQMSAVFNDSNLYVDYKSADKSYRLNFGKNGFNDLPNIIGFDVKNGGAWQTINTSNTDWLPPIAIIADSGDGAELIYTGGNHGSSGGASGSNTARNTYYDVKFDGVSATEFNGGVSKIEINIINEIMASNTITLNRYVMREAFRVVIVDGVISVSCQRTALEPLTVQTDNGLQSVLTGMNDSYLILDTDVSRQAWQEFDSDAKSVNPDVWAIVTQGDGNQFATWTERDYGVGDARYVADDRPLLRQNASGSDKIYHAIVAGTDAEMQGGDNYKWRGGYQVKSADDKPMGADSMFNTDDNCVIVYDADDYMIV